MLLQWGYQGVNVVAQEDGKFGPKGWLQIPFITKKAYLKKIQLQLLMVVTRVPSQYDLLVRPRLFLIEPL